MTGKRVFRSFMELWEHFFPERAKKEQAGAKVETILDKAKFDQSELKRQLTQEQVEEISEQS